MTSLKRSAALGLAAACLASAGCRAAQPAPPPAPAPKQEMTLVEAPYSAAYQLPVRVCVFQNGRITDVDAFQSAQTGDTTVNERPFGEVYPATAEHASAAPWYVNNEPVVFRGRHYARYGLPRTMSRDLVAVGAFRGVRVFVEPGADPTLPEVVYLPVSPDCQFQLYYTERGEPVRG